MKAVRKTVKKKAARPRKQALDPRLELLAERAEARDKVEEARRKSYEAGDKAREAELIAERKALEARRAPGRKALAEARKAEREAAALQSDAEIAERRVESARDWLARREEDVEEDRRKKDGNPRRLSRAKATAFAASLPRAMRKSAGGIVIATEGIRMPARARRDEWMWEFDFVAPGRDAVLAGNVKTRLIWEDVVEFSSMFPRDFRELFPEYEGLPAYGVVAGEVIDEDAAKRARERGFYILRMEGAEMHPDTARGFKPVAY